jgi:hypothetical protein
MSWRKIVAMVLALLVLVTSSRAATVCVESDGNARLEFVGAGCCTEPTTPSTSDSTIGASQCAGCDDAPFGVTGRLTSRDTASADLAAKLFTFTSVPTTLLVAEVVSPSLASAVVPAICGPTPPRDSRPARLHC